MAALRHNLAEELVLFQSLVATDDLVDGEDPFYDRGDKTVGEKAKRGLVTAVN